MKYSFNSVGENVVPVIRTDIGREWQNRYPGKAIGDGHKFPFEFARDRAVGDRTAQERMDFNEDSGLGGSDKGIAKGLALHNGMFDIGFENRGRGNGKSDERAMLVPDRRHRNFGFRAHPRIDGFSCDRWGVMGDLVREEPWRGLDWKKTGEEEGQHGCGDHGCARVRGEDWWL